MWNTINPNQDCYGFKQCYVFLAQYYKYNEVELEHDELAIIHVHKVKSAHNKDTYLKVCKLMTYNFLE